MDTMKILTAEEIKDMNDLALVISLSYYSMYYGTDILTDNPTLHNIITMIESELMDRLNRRAA